MNTAKEILAKAALKPLGLIDHPDLVIPAAWALEAMTEHTDLATKALREKYSELECSHADYKEETKQLREWKRQMLEVWGLVLDWGQKNVELGKSIPKEVLKNLQEHRQLKERADKLEVALSLIENGTAPFNDAEAWSWIETARNIASAALTAYQTNKNEA